jgi:hypothetical protein
MKEEEIYWPHGTSTQSPALRIECVSLLISSNLSGASSRSFETTELTWARNSLKVCLTLTETKREIRIAFTSWMLFSLVKLGVSLSGDLLQKKKTNNKVTYQYCI